jgi:hypothetical protein
LSSGQPATEGGSELRVRDLGAGNGMVGELLDAARVVGVDISDSARRACERDRPHAYDAYYVTDMSRLDGPTQAEMKSWQLDCLSCIAALGFGDIPVRASDPMHKPDLAHGPCRRHRCKPMPAAGLDPRARARPKAPGVAG